ncbi:MAG: preprotein translocase subunit SecG [Ideonella sp.]|nr:preprotein translocase subunit SecG [Ideonella sp.]MCC7459295.1 preprotein translocase subunit SecG [Nitrospira sp.]
MNLLSNLVLVVQILSAVVMIGLVLIQHGKGADMGASFGSGASGSLFGATGSANFLSRSTAVCAALFFVSTLALALMAAGGKSNLGGNTVLDRPAAASAPAGASAPVIPGAVIPGAASAPLVPATPAAATKPTLPSTGSTVPSTTTVPAVPSTPASR